MQGLADYEKSKLNNQKVEDRYGGNVIVFYAVDHFNYEGLKHASN